MRDINIYAFADEAATSFDEQIIALKRNNLKGLEARKVDGEKITTITLEKAKIMKQKLDDAGLITFSIASPIAKINIRNDFKEHLETFKHTLEVGSVLDCHQMRIFSFRIKNDNDYLDYRNEIIERLSILCEAAKPYGMELCHENEKGIYGDIAVRYLDILKEVPYLKGIFDPANFVQCGQDTLEAWDMLSSYIKYMHIKDVDEKGVIVPAGKGIGNVKEISEKYIALGGKDFSIEPHLAIFDGLKDLEGDEFTSKVKYANATEAFDVACSSFKALF